jgi:hypothetical protein
MTIIKRVSDAISGKAPLSAKRSSKWPLVRKNHLQFNPTCSVCGRSESIEVHHIRPFHLHPDLELDPKNLISLCESKWFGGLNCHLLVGHLGSFKSWNETVKKDAAFLAKKFLTRPTVEKE